MAPQYTRKTRDLYVVQVRFKQDWHDVHTDESSAAAYTSLLAYRENVCPTCTYRIVKRTRVAKETS